MVTESEERREAAIRVAEGQRSAAILEAERRQRTGARTRASW